MSDQISIRRVIERLIDGTIRIPGFQRKFVWEPDRAALLMDSIHKGYPVGSVLLWRTQSRLRRERRLGVFDLPEPDKDFPIDYVLDGQQRLTAIFSTFQTDLTASEADADKWLPIYYDFTAEDDAQASRFVALTRDQFDSSKHFPLAVFLDAVEFARATRDLPEPRQDEIVRVQQGFIETMLPVETFESEDRTRVAIVFERVNRMGIELDVFQLLTAWTWSEEFDLQQQFQELAAEFEDFGFEAVGEDSNLMLRCAAAVLKQEPVPGALVEMSGADVRAAFPQVAEAIRRAIDFVRCEFLLRHVKLMPYASLLIPLSAFFSVRLNEPVPDAQRRELIRWFWRACFSHRYSGNPQRNIRRDILEARKLRLGQASQLAEIPWNIDDTFFRTHQFNIGTVATKSFILLLAQLQPLGFMSGQRIALDRVLAEPNRSEYHHCFPRAFLQGKGFPDVAINMLANIAMISRVENRTISDSAPSAYRGLMPVDVDRILASACLPTSLFANDFNAFAIERSQLLAMEARSRIGLNYLASSD